MTETSGCFDSFQRRLLQFHFDKCHWRVPAIHHIVVHAFHAPVGDALLHRDGATGTIRLFEQHHAACDGGDDIVETMRVPAGLRARLEIKPRHADAVVIDQRGGFGQRAGVEVGHEHDSELVNKTKVRLLWSAEFVPKIVRAIYCWDLNAYSIQGELAIPAQHGHCNLVHQIAWLRLKILMDLQM
jgi:hypothetical protein